MNGLLGAITVGVLRVSWFILLKRNAFWQKKKSSHIAISNSEPDEMNRKYKMKRKIAHEKEINCIYNEKDLNCNYICELLKNGIE